MDQTARYAFQNVLRYASRDGEMLEAQFVEMNAPTGRHSRQVASLRQSIVKAIVETAPPSDPAAPSAPAQRERDEDSGQDEVIDGIEIVNILARSSVDLGMVYGVARELFVAKGILKVDGDVQMTKTLLDDMTAQDFEHLVGAYIANFTLPS